MRFVWESLIRSTPEEVFGFHTQPNALTKLMPPWEEARVIQQADLSDVGSRTIVEIKLAGLFTITWIAQHTIYEPPRVFEDIQVKGPFRRWRHRHVVTPHPQAAVLRDEIEYDPPFGFLGRLVAPVWIQQRLKKLFAFRHEVAREFCERKDSSIPH